MVTTITYNNKVAINENPNIADVNKVKDDDMNEIKSVVNNNATELSNLGTYSESEVNTGKKWINNKPIYRKVVDFGNLPNATSKSTAHGISNLGTIVKMDGFMTNGTLSTILPVTIPDANYISYGVGVESIDTTNITVSTGTDRTSYTAFFIVEYTKTTD